MSLFALADLHLSLDADKSMEVFPGWENYTERIWQNWTDMVKETDTVVVNGDVSWAMSLEGAVKDFAFIEALPGKKIISKGNHDYWWTTMSKMERFLSDNGFGSISILHNNCYAYGEDVALCGTRGWINDDSEPEDAKVLAREEQRLEMSVKAAVDMQREPVVFLHYPPYYGSQRNEGIIRVMKEYGVRRCFYGHLHGRSHRFAVNGDMDGIYYRLVSADFLKFVPYKIF